MGGLLPLVAILSIIFILSGGPFALVRLVEGRRRYLLQVKEQEARIAEAKAKELELEHKRKELEYREALLELERFDRRTGRITLDPGEPDKPDPAT